MPSAQLVLANGDIRTQDPLQPRAAALAIADGRILAVGEMEDMAPLRSRGTRVLDLEGRLCLPGMIDGHCHYCDWALNRGGLDLSAAGSLDDCLSLVRERAVTCPPGTWITGQGFNEGEWPEPRMPLAIDLDRVAPEHPVVLWRCDLHLAVTNTLALTAAGVDCTTPDPPKGVIGRLTDGTPDGVLREMAMELVDRVMPDPAEGEVTAALRSGLSHLHSLGLTGLHDMRFISVEEGARSLRAWQRLERSGDLDLRCWVALPGKSLEAAIGIGLMSGMGGDRLRIGGVKYFADGGMGARTAWLLDPYLDGGTGMPIIPMKTLAKEIAKAEQHGLAVMIHAIGDRACRELVDLFTDVSQRRDIAPGRAGTQPAMPHRIEHLQMIRPEDIHRLAALGVAGCVQPHNLVLDINMIDRCVGDRGQYAYPFSTLMTAGVPLMFGSDCPVASLSPLVNIHAAVTRTRADGSPANGWYPDQRVSVAQAVAAYTTMPAVLSGAGHELGTLSSGKRADLIVLDRNIYDIDPADILNTRVVLTVFDGRVAYERR